MEIEHEIGIERDPEAVFGRLVDWTTHPEWIGGLISSEVLDPTVAVGQRFRQELERGPLRIELEGRVTALERPRLVGFEAAARDVRLECRLELAGGGATTRLRQRTAVRLESFLLRMMASKVRDELEAKQREDLARLKALLESGT